MRIQTPDTHGTRRLNPGGSDQVAFPVEAHVPLSKVTHSAKWSKLFPVVVAQLFEIFQFAEVCGVKIEAVSEKDFAIYMTQGIKLST
jgi:hypothetical protein